MSTASTPTKPRKTAGAPARKRPKPRSTGAGAPPSVADPFAPPVELGPDGLRLWRSTLADFGINDGAGRALLLVACQALDEVQHCERILKAEGRTQRLDSGRMLMHPAVAVQRDARAAFVRALRAMELDPGKVSD